MKGTRLSEDWQLPEDWRNWAILKRPDIDVDEEAEIFRDYWIAIPGQKGVKLNWQATWRNWVRRCNGQNRQISKNGGVSQAFHENLRDIAAESYPDDFLTDASEVRPQMGLSLSDERADQTRDEGLGDYLGGPRDRRH